MARAREREAAPFGDGTDRHGSDHHGTDCPGTGGIPCRVGDPARPCGGHEPSLGDLRFRALLTPGEWAGLPAAVRRRFSTRLGPGESTVYRGRTDVLRRSRAGVFLAHALRLVGAPLPLDARPGGASVISVTEDEASGGQNWTRLYAGGGFPQIIHSAKRFSGPTGLEEYLGRGLTMALRVGVEDGALVFRDAGYFLLVGRRRIAVPRVLQPGRLTVRHEDLGEGAFRFSLDLVHPVWGELVHQSGTYRDAPKPETPK